MNGTDSIPDVFPDDYHKNRVGFSLFATSINSSKLKFAN